MRKRVRKYNNSWYDKQKKLREEKIRDCSYKTLLYTLWATCAWLRDPWNWRLEDTKDVRRVWRPWPAVELCSVELQSATLLYMADEAKPNTHSPTHTHPPTVCPRLLVTSCCEMLRHFFIDNGRHSRRHCAVCLTKKSVMTTTVMENDEPVSLSKSLLSSLFVIRAKRIFFSPVLFGNLFWWCAAWLSLIRNTNWCSDWSTLFILYQIDETNKRKLKEEKHAEKR